VQADTQQLMQYGSLTLSSAHDVLDRANGFINTPWSLEPVSSMTPDEAAAAAAAATAMLAEDPSNGGGSSGGGASSNSGSQGGVCPRLVVPSRACLQSSSGLSPGRGGVVHISEGGLNSPRASATRERASRVLVAVDAGASSSSGSSGGGMGSRAGGVAAAIGIPGSGAIGMEHKLGSGGPGSPISPMHHQQHHRQHQQQHHQHHHHPQQQQRMPHSGLISAEELRVLEAVHEQYSQQQQQQSPRWQSPLAAGAAASRGPYTHQGITTANPSEELFSIGSRGAAADVSSQGIPQPAVDAQHGRQHDAAAAAASGAGAGVQEQGAAADADRAARAQSGAGSFVAAGGQHLKWLFKRTCSSTAGSTPSTSPAASEGALWRSRSTGPGLANGRASGAAADGAAVGAAARSGLGRDVEEVLSDPLPQLPARLHHSHTTGEVRGASPADSRDAAAAVVAAGSAAGSGPVTAVPAGSYAAPLGRDRAAAAAAYDDVSMDPDLAAAIAASLADQQQEQQQQEQPWLSQQPQQQQQPQVPHARLPRSPEEEEQMLRQAIALSLVTSDAGGPQPQQCGLQQQQKQQQQQQQLTTSSMLHQRHSQAATQQQPCQLSPGVNPRDHPLDWEQQQTQQAHHPVHGLGMSTAEPGQQTATAGPQQQRRSH